MELTIFIKYLAKIGAFAKSFITKPWLIIIGSPAFVMPVLTTPQKAILLLAAFFIADFITGIIASWIEFRKIKPIVPGSGKRYVIQSSKLRMSAVKFICYALGILCAWGIETVFVIKEIPAGHISTENLTITTIVIAFFCLIEFYSIFFENVKRMGFDIIQNVKKISSEGHKLYKNIKGETNENIS